MLNFPLMARRYAPTDKGGPTLIVEVWERNHWPLSDDGFGNATQVPLDAYRFIVGDWIYRDLAAQGHWI